MYSSVQHFCLEHSKHDLDGLLNIIICRVNNKTWHMLLFSGYKCLIFPC